MGLKETFRTFFGSLGIFEASSILTPRLPLPRQGIRESFCESREGVFPEKGADLRGSPGTSGEVWGISGEVWETSGEPLDCC